MSRIRTYPHQRKLLCEFLKAFYHRGWVSGTGGGICAVVAPGRVLMAPTGVHKERVAPADLFEVDYRKNSVVRSPGKKGLRVSECGPLFSEIIRKQKAGSVMHSHALSAVLAGDLAGEGEPVIFQKLEMLKGIRGATNMDKHSVAVIQNTGDEGGDFIFINKNSALFKR